MLPQKFLQLVYLLGEIHVKGNTFQYRCVLGAKTTASNISIALEKFTSGKLETFLWVEVTHNPLSLFSPTIKAGGIENPAPCTFIWNKNVTGFETTLTLPTKKVLLEITKEQKRFFTEVMLGVLIAQTFSIDYSNRIVVIHSQNTITILPTS